MRLRAAARLALLALLAVLSGCARAPDGRR